RGLASTTLAGRVIDSSRPPAAAADDDDPDDEPAAIPAEAEELLAEAELDFGEAEGLLASEPNDDFRFALLVNRGTMWFLRRRWDAAEADLAVAVRARKGDYLVASTLAQVYQKKGDPARAIETFGRAIAQRPDVAALYRGRAQEIGRASCREGGGRGGGVQARREE